jgi:type IV pilus assembly protein PilV
MNNLSTHRLSRKGLSVKAYRTSRGFSLLEALIGFMILSIGMLGIASLQGISLKAGKTSVYGSVAMMKVEELFESMRANSSVIALDSYAANGSGTGTANNCSGTTGCLPAVLAIDDIHWWRKNLTAGLPATTSVTTNVAVAYVAAPSKLATVTVTINWNERNKDSVGSVAKTYTSSTNICTVIPC